MGRWRGAGRRKASGVGHEQASETKCIRHYARDEDSVVYLDAPGYEDTAGVEVDIATSIAFKMVAERCAALRFVVLVDCHTFSVDRGGAMRRVATLVSAFVRKFSLSKLAFTFVFTKKTFVNFGVTLVARYKLNKLIAGGPIL